jgi:DNA helicase-2/ATP-dependent DNA helicase PcrA
MADGWLRGLNDAQRRAVEHVHGPLLVLAGAGSGKTRVLTTRIANLIEHHGVPPERIFAVTFTNRAAGEMKERVGKLLGRDPSGLWIGTFHSLGARLLRREAELLGFTRQYTIYDEDDRLSLIKRLLEQQGHSPRTFTPRTVSALISAAKNKLESLDELAAKNPFDKLMKVAAQTAGLLAPALKQANAMDFDDLLVHPLTLFREHPDRLACYRDRFAFILVDEFQDTNKAQYALIRFLGAHGNVCAVGDDDQSIYSWRGADVRNMRDFQRDFTGAELVRLEENYRSTQMVLDAANGVIAENTGRIGKTLRTTRAGGDVITVLQAADDRDEAEWVARTLEARRRNGMHTLEEMAVLYRTNAQSRAFEEAFRRAGVPYRLVGAVSFYDRREVKDLLAYLRLAANPADDEAFLRAVGVPKRGLGDSSLAQLGEAARTWSQPFLATARMADRVPDLRPNVREAFRKFAGQLDDLRAAAAERNPADLLELIIEMIDYEAVLLAEGPEGAERWENVRELVASAANWAEVVEPQDDETGSPLERFLAEAALLSGHDKEKGDHGVTMMTLHTAKGLEWPVVVLAGMEDGLFPLARAEEQADGLEEERRLCYVGITRAKDKLYVTWARARRRGGELRPGIASRFLRALPSHAIEEQRTSSVFAGGAGGGSAYATGRFGGGRAWGGAPARGAQPPGTRLDGTPIRPRSAMPTAAVSADEDAGDEASQLRPRYVKGERVRHRRFGAGTIVGLSGAGRDTKVTVRFDDEESGQKQLLVAYAGLERDVESA